MYEDQDQLLHEIQWAAYRLGQALQHREPWMPAVDRATARLNELRAEALDLGCTEEEIDNAEIMGDELVGPVAS